VGAALVSRPELAYVQNNPDLPNALIYGDSISNVALKVMKDDSGIIINDLYRFIRPHQLRWWLRPGNVH